MGLVSARLLHEKKQRQGNRATGRQGDKETGRQGDGETENKERVGTVAEMARRATGYKQRCSVELLVYVIHLQYGI